MGHEAEHPFLVVESKLEARLFLEGVVPGLEREHYVSKLGLLGDHGRNLVEVVTLLLVDGLEVSSKRFYFVAFAFDIGVKVF